MIKSLRNKFISVLTLVACVMFAMLIGVNANFVNADDAVDTNVFTMYNTASIRTDKDPAGIRFGAQLGLEKFKALAGTEEGASINVVFTANKAGADVSLEKTKTYTVTAEDFANDEDGIINIMYTLTFDNEWDDAKTEEAYAMSLTVGCKAYKGETEVADLGAITQDARSVASFNVLNGEENPALKGYYTSAKMVDGVAPYVAGTVGTKIYVDGATAGSSVYINTVKVNAEIADGFVTIKEADMADLLTTASKNIIQVIDADGNVLAKELNDQIPVYNDGEQVMFSALDGVLPITEMFGEGETVTKAEVLKTDAYGRKYYANAMWNYPAVEQGALTVENNLVKGLLTTNEKYTKATIRVYTEYGVSDIVVKAATMLIDSAEDFEVFDLSTEKDTNDMIGENACLLIDGYYVLMNDVDLDSVNLSITHDRVGSGVESNNVFWGTFDGNYHVITGTVPAKGLFGSLGRGAVVKNFTLDVEVPDKAALIAYNLGTWGTKITSDGGGEYLLISNVNAKASGRVSTFYGMMYSTMMYASFVNCVVDLSDLDVTASGASFIYYSRNGNLSSSAVYFEDYPQTNNNIIISSLPYGVSKALEVTDAQAIKFDTYLDAINSGINFVDRGLYQATSYKIYYAFANEVSAELGKYDKVYPTCDWDMWSGIPEMNIDGYTLSVSDKEEGAVKLNVGESVTVALKDALGTDATFTLVSSAEKTVAVDGSKITALRDGTVKVTVSYTVNGFTHTKLITVVVGAGVYETVDYNTEKTPFLFSAQEGTLPADLDMGGEIVEAYDANGKELTISDGKILGLTLNQTSVPGGGNALNKDWYKDQITETYITVYSNVKAVKIYVKAVTMVIDQASDLKALELAKDGVNSTTGEYVVNGYYYLANDIEIDQATAQSINHSSVTVAFDGNVFFSGTFNGNGHTISGIVPNKGLFGAIGINALITNVKFDLTVGEGVGYTYNQRSTGVVQDSNDTILAYATGRYNAVYPARITNVYAVANGNAKYFYGLFSQSVYYTLTNVIFDTTNITPITGGELEALGGCWSPTTLRSGGNTILVSGFTNYGQDKYQRDIATNAAYDGSVATRFPKYDSNATLAAKYTVEDDAKTAYKSLTDTGLWEVQAYMNGETVVGYIPVWVGAQA